MRVNNGKRCNGSKTEPPPHYTDCMQVFHSVDFEKTFNITRCHQRCLGHLNNIPSLIQSAGTFLLCQTIRPLSL